MVLLQRKLYFFMDPTFFREVQFLPGGRGVQMFISKEPHMTCDFLGGDPLSTPLDPHMNREAVKLIETGV